jgi:signal transduction histidine kinase/ligand-binding sensor domain-containing protein
MIKARSWVTGVLLFHLFTFIPSSVVAQGIPQIKIFTAKDYHAHNFNFDINNGIGGTVFVANFEGLLYYDHVKWHTIHTPGYTRVTVVYRDPNDSIWLGGLNYLGKIRYQSNGMPYLHRVGRPDAFRGDVEEITDYQGQIYFATNHGMVFQVDGEKFIVKRQSNNENNDLGIFDIVNLNAIIEGKTDYLRTDTTQVEPLDNGLHVVVKKDNGLIIADSDLRELYSVDESNGLCSNAVAWVDYDQRGNLWGVTENGVFSMTVPSAFSYFTSHEGLNGEVLCIMEFAGKLYVGTNGGLFQLNGRTFSRVAGISHACWAMAVTTQGLMTATSNGIYLILPHGNMRHLSTGAALSLMPNGHEVYSGEMDGVYLTNQATGSRTKVCNLEKVSKIYIDNHGTVWLQSILGEVWCKKTGDSQFKPYKEGLSAESIATVVKLNSRIVVVDSESDSPFPYPRYSYTDPQGVTWLTNSEGTGLYRWKNGKRLDDMTPLLHSISSMKIRAIMAKGHEVWIGGDQGLTVINTDMQDPALREPPQLLIRSVILNGDSILWGGFGTMPEEFPALNSHDRNLLFTFSLDYTPMEGKNLYRYRLDNGTWSAWAGDQDAEYLNLDYGSHTFEVQGIDPFGRETAVTAVNFSVDYPFYLRWYMIIIYLLLIAFLIYTIMRLRLRHLEHDKLRLEQIVEERTEEVRKAHLQLVKQEKLATMVKLTQGLIDRILNPLNYINNFTKLSEGLVRDVEATINDEKEHISKDNYEDTVEVLGMLRGNLQKVGEHGQNTSRTLKAMEEVLRDRTGGVVKTDVVALVRQIESTWQVTAAVKPVFDCPDTSLFVMANPELLSRVFISLLTNSVYAIKKRKEKLMAEDKASDYQPKLILRVTNDAQQTFVIISDNGNGIEQNILEKIFDPFFTTKTTGEASGIGLYLSYDIIQNYGGQITVESVKDDHTTFTITLPLAPKE